MMFFCKRNKFFIYYYLYTHKTW